MAVIADSSVTTCGQCTAWFENENRKYTKQDKSKFSYSSTRLCHQEYFSSVMLSQREPCQKQEEANWI